MKFGLSDNEWDLLSKTVIQPLKNQGCQVWIFGSRARGVQKEFSDIDLLFELPPGSSLPSGFLSNIKEQIEESRLSYKVDLVEWSHLATSYRASVLTDRVPL